MAGLHAAVGCLDDCIRFWTRALGWAEGAACVSRTATGRRGCCGAGRGADATNACVGYHACLDGAGEHCFRALRAMASGESSRDCHYRCFGNAPLSESVFGSDRRFCAGVSAGNRNWRGYQLFYPADSQLRAGNVLVLSTGDSCCVLSQRSPRVWRRACCAAFAGELPCGAWLGLATGVSCRIWSCPGGARALVHVCGVFGSSDRRGASRRRASGAVCAGEPDCAISSGSTCNDRSDSVLEQGARQRSLARSLAGSGRGGGGDSCGCSGRSAYQDYRPLGRRWRYHSGGIRIAVSATSSTVDDRCGRRSNRVACTLVPSDETCCCGGWWRMAPIAKPCADLARGAVRV